MMIRHPIPRAHPPLVIIGTVWRRWLTHTGRIVTITLPIINFGRLKQLEPSITVTVRECRRGRHVAIQEQS